MFPTSIAIHSVSHFKSPENKKYSLKCLFDRISLIVDVEQKMPIVNWLAEIHEEDISGVAKLYLADHSGRQVFGARLEALGRHDYHVFNVLFGTSSFGARFAKDMKSRLLTTITGFKILVKKLSKCHLTESGYLRLIKGLSQMFLTVTDEEKEMLTTNAKTLLLTFKGLTDETDNRVLVRELLLDRHIPFMVKQAVVSVLETAKDLDNLPLYVRW